jgi:hypothetical protein
MGKPLSKASEGGDWDILGEWKDVTKSEVQHGSGKHVLIVLEVRPEPFRSAYPCPYAGIVCHIEVKKDRPAVVSTYYSSIPSFHLGQGLFRNLAELLEC